MKFYQYYKKLVKNRNWTFPVAPVVLDVVWNILPMIVDCFLFVTWPNMTKGSFDCVVGCRSSKGSILSRLMIIGLVELKMELFHSPSGYPIMWIFWVVILGWVVTFSGHKYRGKENITFFTCHLTSCDHVIERTFHFVVGGSLSSATILSNLVARELVLGKVM